jgi:hypothetical protein
MSTIGWVGLILVALFFAGAFVATAVACLGLVMGWFRIGSGNTEGKSDFTFKMNENKVLNHKNAVAEKVRGLGYQAKVEAAEATKDTASPAM